VANEKGKNTHLEEIRFSCTINANESNMVRGDVINDNSFAVGLESFDGDLFDVHGVCEWGGRGRGRLESCVFSSG